MKIIYDAMGGDNAPHEIIKGAYEAIDTLGILPVLVGHEDRIRDTIGALNLDDSKVEIVHAPDVITNEENPVKALRTKRDSSLTVAYNLLNEEGYDGLISAGNTGSILAGGIFISKRITGVDRAVLPVAMPSAKGPVTIVDSGANMDCSGELLSQFAVMGYIYAKEYLKIENPKVGLLNVGSEKGKGNEAVKKAYELIEESNLNFIGNIEARDIMTGAADVVICDGFAGNILLKNTEGVALFLLDTFKKKLMEADLSDENKILFGQVLKGISKELDYKEFGGTPLLGIEKAVVKAHGSSDSTAIKNATKELVNFINNNTIKILSDKLGEIYES